MPRKILKPECYEEYEVLRLPEDYRSATQEEVSPSVKPIIDRLIDSADLYARRGYTMVLSGREGSGKSFAAAVIAKKTMETGLRALWSSVWAISDAVRWDQEFSAQETYLHRVQNVSLLVIDDVMEFTDAERYWTLRDFRTLLRRRSEARLATILTTTQSLESFDWLRASVASFLGIELREANRRLKQDLAMPELQVSRNSKPNPGEDFKPPVWTKRKS